MGTRAAEQRQEARQLAARLEAEGVRNVALTWVPVMRVMGSGSSGRV